jgi:protein involved in polysaccharide export with SLBB domain
VIAQFLSGKRVPAPVRGRRGTGAAVAPLACALARALACVLACALTFATLLARPAAAADPVTPPETPLARLALAGAGLERAISGAEYRLGPGDSLAVGIWGPTPVTFVLPVSLEGQVIIPAIGELNVNGLLLDDARARIRSALLKQFHDVEITISLVGLRRFQVHVLGQVARPGTYLATAVDRVSAAIGWAGDFLPRASQRNIAIANDAVAGSDSLRAHADLFAFLKRGIATNNPCLREGDRVYVPFVRQRFSVQGAVNEAGAFEYLEGDRLSDAIAFAGGFASDAFPDTLEVARYLGEDRHPVRFSVVANGSIALARAQDEPHRPQIDGHFTVRTLDAEGGHELTYPDFTLRPDDIVFVRAIPEYRIKRLVEVQGEVVYPGNYAIIEGETRISDVIRRAGGITPEAFLREATIVRRDAIRLEDKEFERLKTVPAVDMTEDEYEYFKLRSRENRGLMVVDFHALINDHDPSQDLLLRSGDLIVIPKQRDFVSVLGMVRSPGNVMFEPGRSAEEYIRQAGGFAEKASKGKARVIRASTGEWVSLGEAGRIESGDTIWIPEKPQRKYGQLFKDIILVTTQIVTIYLVVDRAVNK